MKMNQLNPANNWSYWTENQIIALENNQTNTNVGEVLIFSNSNIKIWSIHLEPNSSLPFHKHQNNYIWSVLSTGKSISYFNDGRVMETHYEIGDTKHFKDLSPTNYFIHNLINTGNTSLIFMTIEFLNTKIDYDATI